MSVCGTLDDAPPCDRFCDAVDRTFVVCAEPEIVIDTAVDGDRLVATDVTVLEDEACIDDRLWTLFDEAGNVVDEAAAAQSTLAPAGAGQYELQLELFSGDNVRAASVPVAFEPRTGTGTSTDSSPDGPTGPGNDAGTGADPDAAGDSKGCGCGSSGPAQSAGALALLALLWRRRLQRPDPGAPCRLRRP